MPMNPDELAFGFLEYVVFLLSTTCHEASHALVAKLGGDLHRIRQGGQVSLNPIPHIRREPFGMVVMPLLGILSQTGLIGWASAPYDPLWSQKYPKRAAWMSLAGPGANFAICLIAGILMRLGLALGDFVPGDISTSRHRRRATPDGVAEGIATILSVFFSLNLLLGCFNLLPFPPLDGYSVLGLFTTEAGALKLQAFPHARSRAFASSACCSAGSFSSMYYEPLLVTASTLVYAVYRFS